MIKITSPLIFIAAVLAVPYLGFLQVFPYLGFLQVFLQRFRNRSSY